MATVNIMKNKRSQTRGGLAFILSYCKRESKTQYCNRKLVTGVDCVAESAYHEMMNTKMQYGKTGGRMFYHMVQSFSPEENISPETAHEIALKFAEQQFQGYEILVATHVDKEHIHSHFVVNSVSFKNGHKYHSNNENIQRLRNASDKLCLEYDFSIVKPKTKSQKTEQMSSREYRSAERGESWKMQLIVTIEDAMAVSRTKKHFIALMEAEGYEVKWTNERKNITYTTPDGFKCRDSKLHEEKFLKENMENEFRIRNEITAGFESESTAADETCRESRAVRGGYGTELESDDRFSEYTDRNVVAGYGYSIDTYYEGRTDRISESAARLPDRVYGGGQGSDKRFSDIYAADGKRIYRIGENGDLGFIGTGWENERELFEESLYGEGCDEEIYEKADYDFSDTDSGSGVDHLRTDTAYLFADLTNIIDNDHPARDCTTIRYLHRQKKKNTGHTMGGM